MTATTKTIRLSPVQGQQTARSVKAVSPIGQAVETPCKHYWMIDPPEGPESKAVCRLCGAKTTMLNAIPYDPDHASVIRPYEFWTGLTNSYRNER